MIDFSKPVQTRDGRKARIICTDANHIMYPIVVLITTDGLESPYSFAINGQYDAKEESSKDLVNAPDRQVHADLIIAWANGAKIQQYGYLEDAEFSMGWVDQPWPAWNPFRKYRIKPE